MFRSRDHGGFGFFLVIISEINDAVAMETRAQQRKLSHQIIDCAGGRLSVYPRNWREGPRAFVAIAGGS